jgi:hypothetical protein
MHRSAASHPDLSLLTAVIPPPVPTHKKLKRKRFTLDLTLDQHRVLKGAAVKAGLTMRILVLQLLHREGLLGEAPLEPDPEPEPGSTEEASKS